MHVQLWGMKQRLLSFGHGYSAQAIAARLPHSDWEIAGTSRSDEGLDALSRQGIIPLRWGSDDVTEYLGKCEAILSSIAPQAGQDPVLAHYGTHIQRVAHRLKWVGYLSTTGVYGDHHGGWVDEQTRLTPGTDRGKARVRAEEQWATLENIPLHIFRLAGIYGPGRGPFEKVKNGTARRIIKEGQVFSRIHVEDIAQTVVASLNAPQPGEVYNLCDDDPAPPEDVIAYAAELLGCPMPEAVRYEDAEMTPMARSFYAESKRVDNTKIKTALGIALIYPDYKTGLQAMLAGGAAF